MRSNRRSFLLTAGASAAAVLAIPAVGSSQAVLPSAPVSETLARFCRYLCAAATTMPDTLRDRLSGLTRATPAGFSPELERAQAERLSQAVLRLFASRALRSAGLECEAEECDAAATEPLDAAYAASRGEMDIHCMTSERRKTEIEAVAQVVALNASRAYFGAIEEADSVVPISGDYAALAVLAWESASAALCAGDDDWLWRFAVTAVAECLGCPSHAGQGTEV